MREHQDKVAGEGFRFLFKLQSNHRNESCERFVSEKYVQPFFVLNGGW